MFSCQFFCDDDNAEVEVKEAHDLLICKNVRVYDAVRLNVCCSCFEQNRKYHHIFHFRSKNCTIVAADAKVNTIPIYRTLASSFGRSTESILADGADLITFTSSSTVRNFIHAIANNENLRQILNRAKIACIGPVTAETAEKLGLHIDIIAQEHTIPGLIDAMIRYYQEE